MDEEKRIIEAAKELGLGELVPEIYRDMLQPAAREIGDGLATIAKAVKICLAPLEAGIWGYAQIRDWLSVRVTRIHADRQTKNIKQPPLSIAGPLVFQMIFAKDEPELRELYASLLSSAMDKDNASPHPAFVNIIQQLTPDEAKILRFLANYENEWPHLLGESDTIGDSFYSAQCRFSDNWCGKSDLTYPDRSDAYLDNLIRLRILQMDCHNEVQFTPEGGNEKTIWADHVSACEHTFIQLSDFGRQFLDACIEKSEPQKK